MNKFFVFLINLYIFEICSKMLISKTGINFIGLIYITDFINAFIIILNLFVTIYLLTRKFNLLKIEFFILVCLLIPSVFTLLVNGFRSETVIHVITMLKFYPFIFIWRYVDDEILLKILNKLKLVSFIEIGLGLLQYIGGERIYNIFVPAKKYNQILSVLPQDYSNWNGDIFGSFEVQISYSYFIFFSYVLCNRLFQKNLNKNIYFILTAIVLVLSGSSIIILAFLFYSLMNIFIIHNINKYLVFFIFVFLFLFILSFYLNEIFDYFSIAYESNRLGIIINLVPDFFSNQNIGNMLFGYGCENDIIQKKIFSSLNIPTVFLSDENTAALQDVYFVAHMFYFGFFGVIMLFFMIHYCIKYLSKGCFYDQNNLIIVLYLLYPLLFVNQLFNIEVGNFFIFLIIGILIFLKKKNNDEKVVLLKLDIV